MSSTPNKKQAEPQNKALAHLFATVDRQVADLRSGELSGRDVRQIARERGMDSRQAWGPQGAIAKRRGPR